jgi:hypothetical protein
MAEKQYYVKVTFDWGVDNGDGSFESKNFGSVLWNGMEKPESVALENNAVIPALNQMNTEAGKLGLTPEGGKPVR